MSTKEELFVSVSPEAYRRDKSDVLMSQADLLETLKRIHNLKVLAREKHDLKKRLHKLFSIVQSDIDSLQDKMPTPKVPKTVKKEEVSEEVEEKEFKKRDDIEDELKLIQEKLREIND
jgi:hypothetical protein